jgi:competence protein ComK
METYEISKQTLAIIALNEETSKVIEEDKEFIINRSSKKIINDSCKFFGSSYEGRFQGTKTMLGISHKSPIIIEESSEIIFFPTSSPRLDMCSWISLNNIKDYYKDKKNTIINFSCGKVLNLDISYGIIDNQVLRATRLQIILKNKKNMLKNS